MIVRQWVDCFGRMGAQGRMLDIATGNGLLPLLFHQRRTDGECDGIDVADISPAWLKSLPDAAQRRIRLHAKVSAESMPFPAGTFDLVVSQYGLEYSDLSRSIPELVRVLAPGGEVRLLMHHSESRPAQLAREERGHIQWLRSESSWFDAAQDMLLPMSLLGQAGGLQRLNADAGLAAVRSRFDQEVVLIRSRASDSACPDLLNDVQAWMANVFKAAAQRGLGAARAEWVAVRGVIDEIDCRLADMLDHALSESELKALLVSLQQLGVAAEFESAQEQGFLMGWLVSGTRN